jgi:hypothetical protein
MKFLKVDMHAPPPSWFPPGIVPGKYRDMNTEPLQLLCRSAVERIMSIDPVAAETFRSQLKFM